MIPGLPAGASVSTYGNVERIDGFKLPGPYKLSGEVPDVRHDDVKAITDIAFRRNIHANLLPGLVIMLSTVSLQVYVTFYLDNSNRHRFQEASGEQLLFSKDHLREFTAWLDTKGSGAVTVPAAPWRPYALPTAQAFGPNPVPGENQPEGHSG